MSTYDYLIQKGEKIGEKIGIEKKSREAIFGLFKKFPKMNDKDISEIIKVKVSFVKELRKEFNSKKK